MAAKLVNAIIAILILLAVLCLCGCNTIAGMGRDLAAAADGYAQNCSKTSSND